MRNYVFLLSWLIALVACTHGAKTPSLGPESTLEVPRLSVGDAAAPSQDDREGVRFGRKPARVGQRFGFRIVARSVWKDAQAPSAGEETSVYDSQYVVEIVAVDGPAPSKVSIHFSTNVTFEMHQPAATPIHGKSYLVSATAPYVLDNATNAVPAAEEVTRVSDVLPDLGTRAQIDQVLPDGAMRVGESRDGLASAIVRILHPRYWSLDRGTAVLARADATGAVFDVAIEATSGSTGMRMAVKGSARVALEDARLEGFDLRGKFVRPNGEEGQIELSREVRDLSVRDRP